MPVSVTRIMRVADAIEERFTSTKLRSRAVVRQATEESGEDDMAESCISPANVVRAYVSRSISH